MSTNLKTIWAMGFALMLFGLCASSIVAQPAAESRKQLPAVIQYNGDMENLLAHLPSVYGQAIGLEIDPQRPRSTVEVALKDPTLADVLNAITKSSPRYRWTEREDFIEVAPLEGSSPFLDTRISRFRVDYAGEAEAINQLLNLPEVQTSMNDLRLRYREPSASAVSPGKKMSFAVQDLTLRQVLNKIADENGSRFWVLQRNSAGIFSISTQAK